MENFPITPLILSVLALVAIILVWRSQRKPEIGPDEASQLIKKFAENQKIRIELTEDQMNLILEKWNEQNVHHPAEITFVVADRTIVELKVAGYRYRGDSCCV